MSKYDNLDARKELEQQIAIDFKKAFEKRGLTVVHNGTETTHAPAGNPDIEVFNDSTHINIEVTKLVKSGQDGEWQSIKDHFEKTKRNNASKNCYLWFISPETYYRTINSIMDWNFAHKPNRDQKILPICFSTFELFINKLIESPREQYTTEQFLSLFDKFVEFNDDSNILRQFYENLFYSDTKLRETIEGQEEERHQKVVEELITGFKSLEQKLRQEMIAVSGPAIKNVIYLVFIKLYEEKKEKEEKERNRFKLASFQDYQTTIRDKTTAIHKLFADIKRDPKLIECKLFTDEDVLSDRLYDEFVIENFIKKFEEYPFYTTKVDGLGAAYEVLGQISSKDREAGQFFTPEKVVKFMVKMAELSPSDYVYDPACGTARFLTYSMDDMISKVKGKRNESELTSDIRKKQLFGTDDGPTVAKLAKMNMYIHNDGKTNIKDADGLTQYDKDNKIDIILTNPPLGDLSYWRAIYDNDFRLKRMEVIPKKNITQEELENTNKQIKMNQEKLIFEKLPNKISRINRRLAYLQRKKIEVELKIEQKRSEYITSGSQMKGGALFLNSCKHYLKSVRDSSALSEWRGGKILIILDEGILNTEDYKEMREFVKKYFYIKAVISLTRDTFVPVSNTSTKTSILYAIKKEDPDAKQQEPIFFAHAEKVGLNTKKKVCPNHLFNNGNDILTKYKEFEQKILASYEGVYFNKSRFLSQGFTKGVINE